MAAASHHELATGANILAPTVADMAQTYNQGEQGRSPVISSTIKLPHTPSPPSGSRGSMAAGHATPVVRMMRLAILTGLLLLAVLCVWLATQPTRRADGGSSRRAEKRAAERREFRWRAILSFFRKFKPKPAAVDDSKPKSAGGLASKAGVASVAEPDDLSASSLMDDDDGALDSIGTMAPENVCGLQPQQQGALRAGFSTPPRASKSGNRGSRRPAASAAASTPLPAVTPQRGHGDDLWDSPLLRHENVDAGNSAQGLLLEYIPAGDVVLHNRLQQSAHVNGLLAGQPAPVPRSEPRRQALPVARSALETPTLPAKGQEVASEKRPRRRRRQKASVANGKSLAAGHSVAMQSPSPRYLDSAIIAHGQASVLDPRNVNSIAVRAHDDGTIHTPQHPIGQPQPRGASAPIAVANVQQLRNRREKAKWGDMDQPTPMFKAKASPSFFSGSSSGAATMTLDTTMEVAWSDIQLESPQQTKQQEGQPLLSVAHVGADASDGGSGGTGGPSKHELYTREKRLRKRRKQKKFYPN